MSDLSQVTAVILAGGTQAQFALRYCLSQSGITTVIPGMLNSSHVEENVEASDLGPLPQGDLEYIRQVYQGHRFFVENNII